MASRERPNGAQAALRSALGGFVGSLALAGGAFAAVALGGTAISRACVERERARRNVRCASCEGARFVACATCRGKRAIAWQPIAAPSVDRMCLCPTCQGSALQKCVNCLGRGVV